MVKAFGTKIRKKTTEETARDDDVWHEDRNNSANIPDAIFRQQ